MQISRMNNSVKLLEQTKTENKVLTEGEGQLARDSVANQTSIGQEPHKVNEKSLIDALEKANKVAEVHNVKAEFKVHEKTKDIMVRIIDTDTKEVLREFPPEKMLDLIAKIWDMVGLFVDKRG